MHYFVSYICKSNTAERFQIKQLALGNLHPFEWLKSKDRFKNIETFTLISFQNISIVEFENFPGEKVYKELDEMDIENLIECRQEVL